MSKLPRNQIHVEEEDFDMDDVRIQAIRDKREQRQKKAVAQPFRSDLTEKPKQHMKSPAKRTI